MENERRTLGAYIRGLYHLQNWGEGIDIKYQNNENQALICNIPSGVPSGNILVSSFIY